ncbi:GNAT family N-acetyltransferase [Dyella flagellata]|nr:GNAT family N-acetyltransferase [Dyella flagellata]
MDEQVGYASPGNDKSAALRVMARRCFTETFSHLYEPEPFARFLDEVYGDSGSMSKDLLDPGMEWLVAEMRGEIIGYAKLRPLAAPAPNPRNGSLELQQIYVLREWHGRGIAERLMLWALDRARTLGAPEIYLTVFDHNERAKRFYARHGFTEVGRCTFQLGDRIDDDRVWRKTL